MIFPSPERFLKSEFLDMSEDLNHDGNVPGSSFCGRMKLDKAIGMSNEMDTTPLSTL